MEINRNNYETLFLLYQDGELPQSAIQKVQLFLLENPDLKKDFELLLQTRLMPTEILFEKKASLLRKEDKRKVIPIFWLRLAAAMIIIMLGTWIVLKQKAQRIPVQTATSIDQSVPDQVKSKLQNADTGPGDNKKQTNNSPKKDNHFPTADINNNKVFVAVKSGKNSPAKALNPEVSLQEKENVPVTRKMNQEMGEPEKVKREETVQSQSVDLVSIPNTLPSEDLKVILPAQTLATAKTTTEELSFDHTLTNC